MIALTQFTYKTVSQEFGEKESLDGWNVSKERFIKVAFRVGLPLRLTAV